MAEHAELRRSALNALGLAPVAADAAAAAPLSLCELPGRTQLNIRLDGSARGARAALKRATGLAVPPPCRYEAADGRYLAWLSPDEWLLVSEHDAADTLLASVGKALARVHHAVNEVSSAQTVIRLQGEAAAAVLARGCTLDLHFRAFPVPACAQTRIALTQAFIRVLAEHHFEIIVRRSYAEYLWQWLLDACGDLEPLTGTA